MRRSSAPSPVVALTSRIRPWLPSRPPPQAVSAAARPAISHRVVVFIRGHRSLHQQMLAGVVAAEDDVVHLADVGELGAAGIRDRALHVLAHLAQRLGERALDRLEDALAFDVLVLALVEVGRRAVVLLEQLAVDLDRLARRLLVAGEERADHDHAGAEADALGDVAVVADAAVGDDRLGRDARAPLQRRELPAAGAEAGLELGDADLARADADLGRIRTPVL